MSLPVREKFPLLEQLRADRERTEAEISAPWREHADSAWRKAQSATDALRIFERAFASDVAKHLAEEFAHDLASMLRREVGHAMARNGMQFGGLISVVVEADKLSFASPNTWEKVILDQFRSDALPAGRLSVDDAPIGPGGKVDITLRRVTLSIPVLNVTRDLVVDR